MNKFAKTAKKVNCTNEFSAQYLHLCDLGKPLNFTTVIEAKRQKVGAYREFLGQIFKRFSSNKYAKTAIKLSVAMPNSRIPANF